MSEKEISETVKLLVSQRLRKSVAAISEDSSLAADLSLDSLAVVELAMDLEKELSVEIPNEKIEEWITIGDVCKILSKLINKT